MVAPQEISVCRLDTVYSDPAAKPLNIPLKTRFDFSVRRSDISVTAHALDQHISQIIPFFIIPSIARCRTTFPIGLRATGTWPDCGRCLETQQTIRKKERKMKAVLFALMFAFIAPAFAGDVSEAKTEADCQKAGGIWDAK